MSCIPKILELKGDNEFIYVPSKHQGIVIEGGGNYKGYDFLIIFQEMGFRCGYVALPPEHPMNESKHEYLMDIDLEVHGGVTFFSENHLSAPFFGDKACTDKWIGFDAGHAWDAYDLENAIKYFPNMNSSTREHIEKLIEINKIDTDFPCELRTKEYMEQQCKNLVDQLIEYGNENK